MHDRSALGDADVSDAELAVLVGRSLGIVGGGGDDAVVLLESTATVSPYDLEALTTAGRYRVRGRARTPTGDQPFSFFVKVVQSWGRTAAFAFVPPEVREMALASFPWEVEPRMYRSDLAARLPQGLTMPTAYAVIDIDDESAALWIEEIDAVDVVWEKERFVHAAHLLGRLAGSKQVRETATAGRGDGQRLVRSYAEGRVTHQVAPALRSDDLWAHPLMTGTFDDDLRSELLSALDDLDAIVEELESMPVATLHGDACTNNLLVRRGGDDLVLIDFGIWGEGPVGFDLGQLLVGEVQTGDRPASDLSVLEPECLAAYVEGLAAEGFAADLDTVRRAHALHMLLFSGLSSPPLERLDGPPTDELRRWTAERAAAARFMVDLVHATS